MCTIDYVYARPQNNRSLNINPKKASIYIHDGDTISVNNIRYRLYGIDAPEITQEYGRKAKQYIIRYHLHIKRISLLGKDSYGRILGIFYLNDGSTLQEKLLEEGLAILYSQYCKEKICSSWQQIESRAKEHSQGIWSLDDFISPAEYRRNKRIHHDSKNGSKR